MFLVADGPRSGNDLAARECEETREAVLGRIDWNCEVERVFSDGNLGCKERLSSGLDFVFRKTEEAIVLEDDCVPDASFFDFCNGMLGAFRGVEEVMHIGGTSPFARSSESERFRYTRYNRIWGWASWARAWRHFDKNIEFWPEQRSSGFLRTVFSASESRYWSSIFDAVHAGEIDTWDYQWFLCRLCNGVALEPAVNLVSNIGFGSEATHTKLSRHPLASLKRGRFRFPAEGPDQIEVDLKEDLRWWRFLRNERSLVGRFARIWERLK